MKHPKIRLYQRYRLRGGPMTWAYLCSTTHCATKEEALAFYASRSGENASTLRAEFAATHGYDIED